MYIRLRTNWHLCGVFGLMALVAFATFGDLSSHLFEYDDQKHLQDIATALEDPASLLDRSREFGGRPAVDLVFVMGYLLWGSAPAGFHLLSVVFHLLNSWLLFFVFRRMSADDTLSLLAAVLFLLNVSHFRAIHWITALAYPLSLFFSLVGLLCFLHCVETKDKRWLVGAGCCMGLAVAAHPASVCVGVFCGVYFWHKLKSVKETLRIVGLPLGIGLAAAGSIFLFYNQASQVEAVADPHTFIDSLTYFLWFWGRLVLTAHGLPTGLPDAPSAFELTIGFFALAGCIWLGVKRGLPVSAWIGWSFLTMIPFLIHPRWMPVGPSRFLYLPSVGTSFVLAFLILTVIYWVDARLGRRTAWVGLGLVCLGIGVVSVDALKRSEAVSLYISGRNYLTKGTLGSQADSVGVQVMKRALLHDADLVPRDAYTRLAPRAFFLGDGCQDILQKGIEKHPDWPELRMLLAVGSFLEGGAEIRQRGEEEIARAFEQATDQASFRTETALALANLAGYFFRIENYERSVDLYQKSLQWWPSYTYALSGLGNAFYMQGKLVESFEAFEKLSAPTAEDLVVFEDLGKRLYDDQKYEAAVAVYRKVLALSPDRLEIWQALAVIFYEQKRLEDMIEAYRNMVRLRPKDVEALNSLGFLLLQVGRYDDSIAFYQRLIQLTPQSEQGNLGLAQAYERAGRLLEAQKVYQTWLAVDPKNKIARENLERILDAQSQGN